MSGLPPPELTWLLDGKPVLPDASHKMLVRETGVHSLLIDPLTQRDAGTYTCVATNKTGQNSFSLELTVVGKVAVGLLGRTPFTVTDYPNYSGELLAPAISFPLHRSGPYFPHCFLRYVVI